MSQTFQIINMIVLVIAIGFSLYRLSGHGVTQAKKKEEDEVMQRWADGAEMASKNLAYQTDLKENFKPLSLKEDTNFQGKYYSRDEWRYTMPESTLNNLRECFEGDEYKINAFKRAIELALEHYTYTLRSQYEK
jgi:hypothetical protein